MARSLAFAVAVALASACGSSRGALEPAPVRVPAVATEPAVAVVAREPASDEPDAPVGGVLVWRTRRVPTEPSADDGSRAAGEPPRTRLEHETLWLAAAPGATALRVVGRLVGLHAALGDRVVRYKESRYRTSTHGSCPGDARGTHNPLDTGAARLTDVRTAKVVFELASQPAPPGSAAWSTRLELVGSAGPYWFVHELRRTSMCDGPRDAAGRRVERAERVPHVVDARSGARADDLARDVAALAARAAPAVAGLAYLGFTARRDAIEAMYRAPCAGCDDTRWPAAHLRSAPVAGVPASLEADWAEAARAAALTPDTELMGSSRVTPEALAAARRAFGFLATEGP